MRDRVRMLELTCKSTGKVIDVNAHKVIFLEDCDDGVGTKVILAPEWGRQVKESRESIKKKMSLLFD